MKKRICLILLFVALLCSCSTISYTKLPYFANFGLPGEVVLTGKAKYYIPDVPCMERITLVYNQSDEVCGLLEGYYNKFILKQVLSKNNISINGRSDFDYIFYGFGRTFFSTVNADEICEKRVKNGAAVLDIETANKMRNADLAIYANKPDIGYKNLDTLVLTVNGDVFSMDVETVSETAASSFLKLLKSDFNTFETKSGIKSEQIFSQIDGHFFLEGTKVSIRELNEPAYLENWVRRIFSHGNN